MLPHTSSTTLPLLLEIASVAKKQGLVPVPHLCARRFTTQQQLSDFISGLAAIGIQEVLAIAGDPDPPLGEFHSTTQMLNSGVLTDFGMQRVGFAAHPDVRLGPPGYDEAMLDRILEDKLSLAQQHALQPFVITQLCFNVDFLHRMVSRMNALGVPIAVGLPGPCSIKSMLLHMHRSGVEFKPSYLNQLPGLAHYQPERLLAELAQRLPSTAQLTVHIYPFNGVAKSVQWWKDTQQDVRRSPKDD
eukprot:NODE_3760_length_906_cov_31.575096_g3607_i0.p1 GENE.NODE_3760_length_906_cov_31.575096_g3607_i0~~NODE_3760_length_906_cov_31.575096_g3607_i0.p1  ORF type:complete len:288 (-),score=59.84 NODE_3760_length_906_cov_31.575096_g3607_i0:43-777(-)